MSKIEKWLIVTVVTIAVFVVSAVAVTYLIPDASGKYTGIKKEVADYSVGNG